MWCTRERVCWEVQVSERRAVTRTCSHTERIRQPTLSRRGRTTEDLHPLEKSPSSSTWEAPYTGTLKEDFPEDRLLPDISPAVIAAIQGENPCQLRIATLSFEFTDTNGWQKDHQISTKGKAAKWKERPIGKQVQIPIQTPEETEKIKGYRIFKISKWYSLGGQCKESQQKRKEEQLENTKEF